MSEKPYRLAIDMDRVVGEYLDKAVAADSSNSAITVTKKVFVITCLMEACEKILGISFEEFKQRDNNGENESNTE